MDRDSKGRFRKKEDGDMEYETGILERTPSLRTFLIMIFVGWLLFGLAPSPKDAGKNVCERIFYNNTISPGVTPTPQAAEQPKSEWKK